MNFMSVLYKKENKKCKTYDFALVRVNWDFTAIILNIDRFK